MALVHDLAECIVGDYTPGQVSDEQKYQEELVRLIFMIISSRLIDRME
jgi:5'-deoxynucleotidase YfbR-like HD superfamily hydrolase